MKWLITLKKWRAFGIFVLLDTICVGMGMGVPIFCILFGFLVGWYITRVGIERSEKLEIGVSQFLPYALITAGYTFLVMMVIWGRWLGVLLDPTTDYVKLGIPMILFEPMASFIGWQVLMILISPFLQILTTLFGAYITLLVWLKNNKKQNEVEIQTIKETILANYHDGHALYDPELYREILHPEWKFFLLEDNQLKIVDRKEFCTWYAPENLDPDLKWETEFYSIDVTGNLAAVKLRIENQNVKYIDYLNLMKIDGKWWIVHKLSHDRQKK